MATDSSSTTVIRDLTPNITIFSVPFSVLGGKLKIGGRCTVVRLHTGSLAVFSPVALTPAVQAKLSALGGPVRWIASVNVEHHLHISAWAAAFPGAKVIAMEGLPEKRERDPATAGTAFAAVFTMENKAGLHVDEEFDSEFKYEYLEATRVKELVFVHRLSGTLIEGDLIFNLPATESFSGAGEDARAGLVNKVLGHMFQAKNIGWQRRLLWHGTAAKEREGLAASLRRISGWEFDRIVPCHGDVIESGGKGVFEGFGQFYLEKKW
ncbi:hypothetical protein NKR23_g3493 [Pleurostoma richardsiae]|uniref:Uncharacterized protein n=1 Tax=Pleurostoma richardsiae TaxID=41990 RepID=A0AA38RM17_9PEZI|nr:hypothetical protein NKR23_g3493 [Pleurostoma richardsiae]